MGILLLIAFVAIPIIEIAVFIEVGGRIGALNTILMVIFTAMLGTWLLRRQGLQTLQRVQESLNRNIFPVSEVFDGLCLLVAGVLLLTPGFVTDTMGFLLFIPWIRHHLRHWIWLLLTRSGGTRVWVNGEDVTRRGPGRTPGTIDGDYHEVKPEKDDDHKLPPRHP